MGETETVPAHGHAGPRPEAAPRFDPDDVIAGRYRVVRFLARGGMGEVYEVEDRTLGSRVALKTMRPELAHDAAVVRRFRREVELARRVTHEHVCRIFDTGAHDDVPFLTMELIDGETLGDRLARDGKLDVAVAGPIVRAMASGLAAAHRAGVIHRDLKPGNVMLAGDRVVVTDFGLAHREVSDDGATALTGAAIVGTPGYMAPEQVLGEPTGTPADVYAFGVVLYELVTGQLPFRGETPMATAALRLNATPRPPRELVPALPEAWQRAILGCLRREAAARLAGIDDVIATLDGAPPRRRRWPVVAAIGAVAIAGAAGAAWLATRTSTPPPRPSPPAPALMHQTRVATGAPGRFFQTTLSPDGRRVAMADGAVRVVDAEGAAPRVIALPEDASVDYASWYRDSSRLLVSWNRAGRSELAEISADGGPARVITDGVQGRISPDGQHLAMLRDDGVYVARLDGSEVRRIAGFADGAYETIAWSQDGRALAILDREALRVISPDGARVETITPPGGPQPEPGVTWMSGGRLVIVSVDPESGDQQVWAIPVDTATLQASGAPTVLGAFPLQQATAIDSGDGERLTLALRDMSGDAVAVAVPTTRAPGTPVTLSERIGHETAIAFTADGAEVYVTQAGGLGRVPRAGGHVTMLWTGSLEAVTILDDATALRVDGDAVVELALADGTERSRVAVPADPARRRVACARLAPTRCVLARITDATELRAFDRATGAGAVIATVPQAGDAAIAPDGASVAVVGQDAGLRIVDVATGAITTRALPCGPQTVTWLDERRPVVSCIRDFHYELVVVEPDDTTWPLVSTTDHWVTMPVSAPDGTWLAFSWIDVSERAFVVDWTPGA